MVKPITDEEIAKLEAWFADEYSDFGDRFRPEDIAPLIARIRAAEEHADGLAMEYGHWQDRAEKAEAEAKKKDALISELTRDQRRIRDLIKGYDPDDNEDERFCRDCADSEDGRCVNGGGGFCNPQRDAEHRVAKLRAAEAERDRLREALKPFAEIAAQLDRDNPSPPEDTLVLRGLFFNMGELRAARAALEEGNG